MNIKLRFDVFKRDKFQCVYCGRMPPDVTLEVDHIIPKACGGINSMENYVTACFECNHGKGKQRLDDVLPEACLAKRQERKCEESIRVSNKVFSDSFPDKRSIHKFKQVSIRHFPELIAPENIKIVITSHEHVTLQEASKSLGVTYMTLWRWIKAGKLVPLRIGGRPFLTINQVNSVKEGK